MNIEWVGYSGRNGSEYETEYDCCGITVEGEGDDGPPPGWCYEGMHTTDVKRARFRDDAESDDDKLVSCVELKCHNARKKSGSTSGPAKTKRPRPPPLEDDIGHDYDDCDSIATEDTGEVEIVHSVGELGQRNEGKGKGNSNSKGMTGTRRTTATAVRPQSRVRVQAPRVKDGKVASKKAGNAGAPTPGARVPSGSDQRSNAKPRSAVSGGSEASRRSRVRGGAAETGDEKTMAESEGKVRKRRKVAARAAA